MFSDTGHMNKDLHSIVQFSGGPLLLFISSLSLLSGLPAVFFTGCLLKGQKRAVQVFSNAFVAFSIIVHDCNALIKCPAKAFEIEAWFKLTNIS